jgi:hypothetical protein
MWCTQGVRGVLNRGSIWCPTGGACGVEQGVIYPVDKGLSPDGKPSVIVDYSNTEAIWDLALRDEARRVRASTLVLQYEVFCIWPVSVPSCTETSH